MIKITKSSRLFDECLVWLQDFLSFKLLGPIQIISKIYLLLLEEQRNYPLQSSPVCSHLPSFRCRLFSSPFIFYIIKEASLGHQTILYTFTHI